MQMFLLLLFSASVAAQCFHTPHEAVRSMAGTAPGTEFGFRVSGLLRDPMSGEAWARVVECGHIEKPAALVPLHVQYGDGKEQVLLHAGQRARIQFEETAGRFESYAIAEQSGRAGQVISVRMVPFSQHGQGRRVRATVQPDGTLRYRP